MWRVAWTGVLIGLIAGCSACSHSRRSQRDTPAVLAPAPPAPLAAQGFAPAPGVPQGFPGAPPPGAAQFPAAPPGPSTAFPTVPQQAPANQFPAAPPGPGAGPANGFPMAPPGAPGPAGPNPSFPTAPPPGPQSKLETNWQPAEAREPPTAGNRVLLGPPEVTADQSGKDKKLYPPQVEATPNAQPPSASLPVGIPQFAAVKQQVATGRRPLEDGFDWLKANQYRTVLHLRLPGADDAADRKQAEDRGLTYQSIEVAPALITKDVVDEFNKLVRDPMRQPIFVYDRDGSLAGGLWYLHFRIADQDSDDVARIRARAAGLREDREGAHRELWQAAQKYLADNP